MLCFGLYLYINGGKLDMEVTVVVGVRPHYVKASGLQYILQDTDVILKFLDIHQHYDECLREIYVREENLSVINLSEPISNNGEELDKLMRQMNDVGKWLTSKEGKKSKAIIVFGDANPALAGAIVANRLNVPIVHIEAGVRRIVSEKEHWNSLIADHLSSLRYCYTHTNVMNLKKEGLSEGSYLVGDLFANWTIEKAKRSNLPMEIKNYILVSIHRPQNCHNTVFSNICEVLKEMNMPVIWIMHPRTNVYRTLIEENTDFYAIPSQKHSNALALIKNANFILTDSGGFVRESVLLDKKVIVCHEQGMWTDLVDCGAIIRSDTDIISLKKSIDFIINNDLPSGKHQFLIAGGEDLFKKTFLDFLNVLD